MIKNELNGYISIDRSMCEIKNLHFPNKITIDCGDDFLLIANCIFDEEVILTKRSDNVKITMCNLKKGYKRLE